MDALARREHSRAELRAKLLARGLAEADVEAALDRLEDDGLLSDARFTEAFCASRARRGQGPVKIRAELSRRGVDPALAAATLAGFEDRWAALAREVRVRKYGEEIPRDYNERARQSRFLAGRGFTSEQVRAAFGADTD